MSRLLSNILFFFTGQESEHSPAGNKNPGVLVKACLLDESKKFFFLDPLGSEKESGIDPEAKPGLGKEIQP